MGRAGGIRLPKCVWVMYGVKLWETQQRRGRFGLKYSSSWVSYVVALLPVASAGSRHLPPRVVSAAVNCPIAFGRCGE